MPDLSLDGASTVKLGVQLLSEALDLVGDAFILDFRRFSANVASGRQDEVVGLDLRDVGRSREAGDVSVATVVVAPSVVRVGDSSDVFVLRTRRRRDSMRPSLRASMKRISPVARGGRCRAGPATTNQRQTGMAVLKKRFVGIARCSRRGRPRRASGGYLPRRQTWTTTTRSQGRSQPCPRVRDDG